MMNNSYDENQIKRPIILIAEDHDVLRESIRDLVSANFPDSDILEARNGEEAIDLAFARKPDVILMDIRMPRINGIEATRHIKLKLPNIHVAIISTYKNPEYKSDAKAAGADAYVLKSEITTDLILVLGNILSQIGKG